MWHRRWERGLAPDRRNRQPAAIWAWALCVVAASGLGACSAWRAPETPENAVIHFGTALQVGTDEEVRDHVCSKARDEGRARPFGYEDLRPLGAGGSEEFGYHGTGVVREDGDSAVVFGDLTVEGGFDYETWAFDLVDEGTWKVCRVRQATSEELRLVSAERDSPPPTYRRTLCEQNPDANGCPIEFTITVPAGCVAPPPFQAFDETWVYLEGPPLGPGEHPGHVYWESDDMTFIGPDNSLTRFRSIDAADGDVSGDCG
jgi:hypothetical protein